MDEAVEGRKFSVEELRDQFLRPVDRGERNDPDLLPSAPSWMHPSE
jgi:hypothetical protein